MNLKKKPVKTKQEKQLILRLPIEMVYFLKVKAAQTNTSMKQIVVQLLQIEMRKK